MADETEVLELDTPLTEQGAEDQGAEVEAPEAGGEEGEEPTETIIGFAGEEEAAPASGSDSSVLRELRKVNREQARLIAELQRPATPAKIEIGPEPTLESSDYDEERFKAEWKNWNARKAEADRAEHEATQKAEADKAAWAKRVEAFEAEKLTLGVDDFEEAEAEVQATLPPPVQALLLKSGKGPALVYALGKNPAKLEELSKLDLPEAAMMIGELRAKLTMEKRRKTLPEPDRAVTGTASTGGVNKELARLEKEAAKTGDRTALIRYRRSLERA